MAWNPDIYNKFKTERYTPFYDLLQLCKVKHGLKVVDLGCGTGELTRILSDHFPGAAVLGIDSSQEMLNDSSKFSNEKTRFECKSIEDQIRDGSKWDLIFSNAALQWIDNHTRLFPEIIALIREGGQLAVQIPSNHDHFTHTSLQKLAMQEPYFEILGGWKRNLTALAIEDYANIFFEHGGTGITVYQKVYPHTLKDANSLFEWVSGTALIPYIERLPEFLKDRFKEDYRKGLAERFRESPVFYPFKRIIMKATF